MTMVESFAEALLYAEKFSRSNQGRFPYLSHQIGVQGGPSGGFYCPECDPKVERQQYRATDVQHLKGCEFLAFCRALTAAKQLGTNPQAR